MKIVKTEEWEESHINKLTLQVIFAATIATLVATGLALTMQRVGVPEIRPELLFAPWGIAVVLGVSIAFHKGVMAERARAGGKK